MRIDDNLISGLEFQCMVLRGVFIDLKVFLREGVLGTKFIDSYINLLSSELKNKKLSSVTIVLMLYHESYVLEDKKNEIENLFQSPEEYRAKLSRAEIKEILLLDLIYSDIHQISKKLEIFLEKLRDSETTEEAIISFDWIIKELGDYAKTLCAL